ncbi:ATP synthase delta chain, chloroplastic-like [Zingiber officinale]|uniref:ATP synthase delta chain, chloroplastic-like n=1 Tax=Zingiber officinale TaxID=94328 RepID=UPI001C4C3A03|nr:ATP synthase delta chain, chloroplastic-like [Zingiber officinale]XP_042443612.1 ATP synthase delta chain, chloroplastic-like [Zingiber officinale]XP_042443613.1 ATP synthase delta chain, chloroplastic-like [Zingiber officinale]
MSILNQSISATRQPALPLKRSSSLDGCQKLQMTLPFCRTSSLKATTKKPSARNTIPLAQSLYQTDQTNDILEFHPLSTSSVQGLLEEVSKEGDSGRFKPSDHVLVVSVSSAVKLDERQIELISKKMQRLTGFQELRLENSIDPSLIAGFVISYCSDGSHVIDLSVKGQLAMLKARLESSDVKQMGLL